MSPLAPAIIVFERRPCRESELKRRLPPAEVLVRPCRAASDALVLVRAMPGSVLVVDLAVGVETALSLLEQLSALRVSASPVVVADDANAQLEWPLRELGVVAFLHETTSGDDLTELCRRLLGKNTSANGDATHADSQGRAGETHDVLHHWPATSTNIGSPGSF